MQTIDTETIKSQVNMQDIVRADLGNDASLAVYEDGGWKCFGCSESGDAITWVMKRQDVDFRRACEILADGDLDRFSTGEPTPRKPRPVPQPPVGDWQGAAQAFILKAEQALWSDAGAKARHYLQEERGLTEKTMRVWHLGYNPESVFDDPAKWDMADGKRKAVWLPRAVVIPHIQRDVVWSIKFRLPKPFRGNKYFSLPGGRYDLYGMEKVIGGRPLWFCEGEFDAMLLWQHIGDVADVVTLGAASVRELERDMMLLYVKRPNRMYLVFDHDENKTGDRAAAELAEKLAFFKPRRINPPEEAKDITDAWAGGVDLREWACMTMGIQNVDNTVLDTQACKEGLNTYHFAFPADTKMPVIKGKWRRTEKGEIEAWYTKAEAEMCMEMIR